ncbi:MAG TPA: hypothetical protein VGV90_12010 [Solirubrobacteraceae bacterium]|nr:hypothetical protein [Solirubrobacteraceae bacterium]
MKHCLIARALLGMAFAAISVKVCGPCCLGSLRLRTRSGCPALTELDPVNLSVFVVDLIEMVLVAAAACARSPADAGEPLPAAATSPAAAPAASTPRDIAERRFLIALRLLVRDEREQGTSIRCVAGEG